MTKAAKIQIFFFMLLAVLIPTDAAAQKVCAYQLSQNGCTGLLSFETDRYGDVVITIENGSRTTGAAFRGNNGMGSDLTCFWVKIPGQDNAPAGDYFEKQYVVGSNTIRLHLKNGVTMPEGAVIYYDGKKSVEWLCDQNSNLYKSNAQFNHTYGTTCATLDAPVLNGMTDYKFDFVHVSGADYYTVSFYLGRDCVYSGRLNADSTTSFRPYITDTYEIVMQAWNNSGGYSDESNALNIPLEGDLQYLPVSEVCEVPFQQSDKETTRFLLTAETDSKGVITITAKAGDGGAEADTKFRNDGLPQAGMKFNGKSVTQYFTIKMSSDKKSIMLTPISGAKPEKGRLLTFNEYGEAQTAAWATSQDNNAYVKTVHFSYRYGSSCPKLATPVITDIVDSVPLFAPVEGADDYLTQVYLGSLLKYTQTIHSGDMLHFVPDQSATYQVTLIARGEGIKQSDESTPFDWSLTMKEVEVGPSEYCNRSFGSGGDKFNMSFETLANGDVEITISGDAKTAFRGNGMGNDLGSFKVGPLGAGLYFEPQCAGTGAPTYTLHLKNPDYVPGKGEKITFNGTVAYVTATNTNAYGTYQFTYTYGSVCDHLDTPQIIDIQPNGTWTLDHPIEGAENYRIMVYRDGMLMQDALMKEGDPISFSPWHDFIYLVYVQACTSKSVMNSALSTPYEWRVKGNGEELPASSLCDKVAFTETMCGNIWLTAQTLETGQVVFSIRNGEEHNVIFRSKGLDNLLFFNEPIESYFDMTVPADDSTRLILTPSKLSAGRIFTGDPITSMGNLEWSSDCSNNGYTKFTFTYLYGTVCTPQLIRLDRPVVTEVTPYGDVLFDTVSNADSYLMRISDGDDGLLTEYAVMPGYRIDRYYVILPEFDYYVRLQAWPEAGSEKYRESPWSDAYLWTPSELPTPTSIGSVSRVGADGKYIIDGRLVISSNGRLYNAQGELIQ